MPTCWICSSTADSSEHMAKASDIRSLFGHITQRNAIYKHSQLGMNVPVKGAKAEALKFQPSICANCNNARTQLHDRAWEDLSDYLRNRAGPLVHGLRVPLGAVFGAQAAERMAFVHFYFLKLFGCYAVEHGAPLPLNALAVSILSGVPHPHVFLTFTAVASQAAKTELLVGPVNALHEKRVLVGATWFYIVGTLGVLVSYSERGRPRAGPNWHPDDGSSHIALA